MPLCPLGSPATWRFLFSLPPSSQLACTISVGLSKIMSMFCFHHQVDSPPGGPGGLCVRWPPGGLSAGWPSGGLSARWVAGGHQVGCAPGVPRGLSTRRRQVGSPLGGLAGWLAGRLAPHLHLQNSCPSRSRCRMLLGSNLPKRSVFIPKRSFFIRFRSRTFRNWK